MIDTGAEDTDNVVYVKDFFNNGREWIREYITDVTVTGVNWRVLLKYLNKHFDRDELHDMWLQFVDSKINSIEVDRTIDLLELLYQNAIDKRVECFFCFFFFRIFFLLVFLFHFYDSLLLYVCLLFFFLYYK